MYITPIYEDTNGVSESVYFKLLKSILQYTEISNFERDKRKDKETIKKKINKYFSVIYSEYLKHLNLEIEATDKLFLKHFFGSIKSKNLKDVINNEFNVSFIDLKNWSIINSSILFNLFFLLSLNDENLGYLIGEHLNNNTIPVILNKLNYDKEELNKEVKTIYETFLSNVINPKQLIFDLKTRKHKYLPFYTLTNVVYPKLNTVLNSKLKLEYLEVILKKYLQNNNTKIFDVYLIDINASALRTSVYLNILKSTNEKIKKEFLELIFLNDRTSNDLYELFETGLKSLISNHFNLSTAQLNSLLYSLDKLIFIDRSKTKLVVNTILNCGIKQNDVYRLVKELNDYGITKSVLKLEENRISEFDEYIALVVLKAIIRNLVYCSFTNERNFKSSKLFKNYTNVSLLLEQIKLNNEIVLRKLKEKLKIENPTLEELRKKIFLFDYRFDGYLFVEVAKDIDLSNF